MNLNIFVKLAKLVEKLIKYVLYVIFEFIGKFVKIIFGM